MSRSVTSFPLVAAGLVLATLTMPAAAPARDDGPYFTAELANEAAGTNAIAGGVVWTCQGTNCVAPRTGTRPLRVCRELQRKQGTITAFTAGNETFDADQLARCND